MPEFPEINSLTVALTLFFHTASVDNIDSSPMYSDVDLQEKITTVRIHVSLLSPPISLTFLL